MPIELAFYWTSAKSILHNIVLSHSFPYTLSFSFNQLLLLVILLAAINPCNIRFQWTSDSMNTTTLWCLLTCCWFVGLGHSVHWRRRYEDHVGCLPALNYRLPDRDLTVKMPYVIASRHHIDAIAWLHHTITPLSRIPFGISKIILIHTLLQYCCSIYL